MPILDTLKTAEDFRQAGFPDPQARVLASKPEEAAQAQSQDFKSVLRQEMSALRQEIAGYRQDMLIAFQTYEARFDARIEKLRADLHSEMQRQALAVIGVLIAVVSLAVAVIKLFPNWFHAS